MADIVEWLCPLCSLESVPHGSSCQKGGLLECPNRDQLNVNGKFYLKQLLKQTPNSASQGLGISEISDE